MSTESSHLQDLAEQAPVIAFQFQRLADGRRRFLYISPAIAEFFGLSPEAVMADAEIWFDTVHPEDRPGLEASIGTSAWTLSDWQWEGRARDSQGRTKWFRGRSRPKPGEDGSIVWSGVLMDFSEAGASGVELPIRLYARALESVPVGILIADANAADMPLIYINPAFERITGYTTDEALGRNCRFLQGQDTEQPELAKLREELKAGRGTRVTLRNYRKDGQPFWNDLLLAPVHDGSGRLTHFIGVAHDITAQRQAETALILAKEEAERANQAKSEFLSSMSHELRTPLNAVIGFAQLLALDPDNHPKDKEHAQEILTAGNHLLKLINEVLDLSRIEAGHLELDLQPVPILELAQECSRLIQPTLHAQQLSLSLDFEDSLDTPMLADRMRLKQVLLNLMSNAAKYNRTGGKVRVEYRRAEGDKMRLSVSDTGHGIAPERIDELFQAFHRLGQENGPIQGTGIGLVISKRLIELMQGRIGVESTPGQGSRFWIELPVASAPSAQAAADSAPEASLGRAMPADGRTHTVLYVEDNPANMLLVKHVMKNRPGIRLLGATEPVQGLELAETERPDLILLDINLPGMSGFDVLQYLKSHAATQGIPVIAVSANAMAQDIERGQRAGFLDYLTKPLDISKFLAAIDKALSGKG